MLRVEVGHGALGLELEYSSERALCVVSASPRKAQDAVTKRGIAGLRAGDLIVGVDGTSVCGESLDACARMVREALEEEPRDGDHHILEVMRGSASRLERRFRASSRLEAVEASVRDDSSWYEARRLVGGRRHMAREVEPGRGGYEAWYYDAVPDEELGGLSLVAKRISAGTAPTAARAWALAEARCRARDAAVAEGHAHLTATIVSGAFVGLDHQSRSEMVVESLLDETEDERSERIPRGFAVGPAAGKLPFTARLDLDLLGSSTLALRLLTPAQWKPKLYAAAPVEKRDARRLERRVVGVDDGRKRRMHEAQSAKRLRDLLAAETDQKHRIGHFFHSLPPRHEAYLVAARDEATTTLVDDPRRRPETTTTTTYCLAAPRNKQEQQRRAKLAAGEFAAAFKVEAECARRLQRIFRRRVVPRAFRRRNRRHLAATRLERAVRRYFGARYAAVHRRVAELAATRIASRYRATKAARRARERRARYSTASVRIQSAARGRKCRRYATWARSVWAKATIINAAARGFVARCAILPSTLGFSSREYLPRTARAVLRRLAATRLQSLARRVSAKKKFALRRDERVVQPARLSVQRAIRGGLGRAEARRIRGRRDAAASIQRISRGKRARLWRLRVVTARRQRRAAREIQRGARGYLDRRVARLRRRAATRKRARERLVPALQANIRRARAKAYVARLRRVRVGAIRVQRAWRTYAAAREAIRARDYAARVERFEAANAVARLVRGVLARRRYSMLRRAVAGRRIRAARLIFRAWHRFRYLRRYDALLTASELENAALQLENIRNLRDDVKRDLEDVLADMRDLRLRRKHALEEYESLDAFLLGAEARLAEIEKEIDDLEVAEIDAGWGEALEGEWACLSARVGMASEERLQRKRDVRACDRDLLDLRLEYDDLDIDLDDAAVAETERRELARRQALKRAASMAAARKRRFVRIERTRWRVRDVRVRLLQRDNLSSTNNSRAASTLDYTKRAAKAAAARDRRTNQKTAVDGTLLEDTYDAVVSGCASLLQAATLEMRTDKTVY